MLCAVAVCQLCWAQYFLSNNTTCSTEYCLQAEAGALWVVAARVRQGGFPPLDRSAARADHAHARLIKGLLRLLCSVNGARAAALSGS